MHHGKFGRSVSRIITVANRVTVWLSYEDGAVQVVIAISDRSGATAAVGDLITLPGGSVGVSYSASGYTARCGIVSRFEAVPFVVGKGVSGIITEPDTILIAHEVIAVLLISVVRPYFLGLVAR